MRKHKLEGVHKCILSFGSYSLRGGHRRIARLLRSSLVMQFHSSSVRKSPFIENKLDTAHSFANLARKSG